MAHRVSATNETGVAPLTTREEASSSAAMDPTEEALRWVELVTDIQRPEGVSLQDWLRSGVVLCELVNLIAPASVARISESDMPFKQMGNIDNYVRRPPSAAAVCRHRHTTRRSWHLHALAAFSHVVGPAPHATTTTTTTDGGACRCARARSTAFRRRTSS